MAEEDLIIKDIRSALNDLFDKESKITHFYSDIEELSLKIKSKLRFLFTSEKYPKVSDVATVFGDDILFYFEFHKDSDYIGFPLSNYKEWNQTEKDLVKPAIIEILLFFKLKKDYEKTTVEYREIKKNIAHKIQYLENKAGHRLKIGFFWDTIRTYSDVKRYRKKLSEISDEELLM